MIRILILLVRFAVIIVAYAAAALAASGFLHAILLGRSQVDLGQGAGDLGAWLFSVLFVALLASYYAFIPAIAAILFGEFSRRREWLYYAVCGGVIAAAVSAMLDGGGAAEAGSLIDRPVLSLLGAGIAGGIVYWALCGRSAGHWRDRAEFNVPERSGS